MASYQKRSYQKNIYQENIYQESSYQESSYQEIRGKDWSIGLVKGDKRSQVQKEERSSQEPKQRKGHKERTVSGSSPPAKKPSKAPKTPDPKKMVVVHSATRYAPGLFF